MIKKAVLDRVGLMDESFLAYFEATDLCRRIRQAGCEIWFYPAARIIHRIESSFQAGQENRLRIYYTSLFAYLRKHAGGYLTVKAYRMAKFLIYGWILGNRATREDARMRYRAIRLAGPDL